MTFNKKYLLATALLLLIEVGIALFVKDRFVRPYVGDFLVVILIYCFLKTFWDESPLKVGLCVLLFSFTVETGQYFRLVERLGLEHSKIARTIIGTGFDWGDLVAYTLGIACTLLVEKKLFKKRLLSRTDTSSLSNG